MYSEAIENYIMKHSDNVETWLNFLATRVGVYGVYEDPVDPFCISCNAWSPLCANWAGTTHISPVRVESGICCACIAHMKNLVTVFVSHVMPLAFISSLLFVFPNVMSLALRAKNKSSFGPHCAQALAKLTYRVCEYCMSCASYWAPCMQSHAIIDFLDHCYI